MKVKCCFLIDATASMGPWIEGAKNHTREIVDTIKADTPDVELSIAAVFYRDVGDDVPLQVIPFTSNVTAFLEAINPVIANGGDDVCEDVASGFQAMNGLDWSDADVKTAFLICDAPPHGRMWHDIDVSDRFLTDETNLVNLVEATANAGIDLTVVKASNILGPMIRVMDSIYSRCNKVLRVADLTPQTPPRMIRRTGPPPLSRYSHTEDPEPGRVLSRTVSSMVRMSIESQSQV